MKFVTIFLIFLKDGAVTEETKGTEDGSDAFVSANEQESKNDEENKEAVSSLVEEEQKDGSPAKAKEDVQ